MGSTRTNVTSLKHHIILLILSKKSLQDNLTKDFYAYIIDGWLILIGDYYLCKRSHLSLKWLNVIWDYILKETRKEILWIRISWFYSFKEQICKEISSQREYVSQEHRHHPSPHKWVITNGIAMDINAKKCKDWPLLITVYVTVTLSMAAWVGGSYLRPHLLPPVGDEPAG